jgi:hypothetical protein
LLELANAFVSHLALLAVDHVMFGKHDNITATVDAVNKNGTNHTAQELWMAQAHWQYSTMSVILGFLHDSSITKDESRSGLNQALVPLFAPGGKYANVTVNMVEVDDVCDSGPALLAALRSALEVRMRANSVTH